MSIILPRRLCPACGCAVVRAPHQTTASFARRAVCLPCASADEPAPIIAEPADAPRPVTRRPAAERFEALWVPEPMSGCHLWAGGVDHHGYGLFWNGERSIGAHRFVFELVNGPVPEGLHVLHRCDTPACCNPLHLYAGTPADNVRDALERGRFAVGSRAAMAKTTEAVVALGRARRLRAREFARETGLSLSAARQALNGETWRHLPVPGRITGITCCAV